VNAFHHLHECNGDECGAVWVCLQRDCPITDWTCPACEDERMADYFRAVGDQPRLPLEPEAALETF
jgi:hypothetical protein